MTEYVFAPPPPAALAIRGDDRLFPVSRIFCIGRNYAAHAVEMGGDPSREPPFFFLKPPTALSTAATVPYPAGSKDVHHEAEMVVALSSGGRDIRTEDALGHVFGYGAGVDLTLRDVQDEAKRLSRPWDVSKGFDHAAPCGRLARAADVGHPEAARIVLTVNGKTRQDADINQMVWKVPELIATISRYFALRAGDLIMTGTPAGVGAVAPGDTIDCAIEGLEPLRFQLTA